MSRTRTTLAAIAGLALSLAALSAAAASPPATRPPAPTSAPPASASRTEFPLVTAVGPISIVVSDLDPAVQWYTSVLDFRLLGEQELAGDEIEHLTGVFGVRCRVAHLALGQEQIELVDFLAPEGRPIPADARSNDRAFQHIAIVVSDMDAAYARLRDHNVRHASAGPQTLPDWNPNAGGISAFYFKDPDGHVLEVIHFPPGKGDPRWQQPASQHSAPIFLGIDHTAIVVRDTNTSLAFYRDALGMRIAGTSENYGIEQERLNNVFGVRLRITALRADHGPGVELLEYLAPATGRDQPADSAMNDLWAWHTTIISPHVPEACTAAAAAGGSWVSPGPVGAPAAPAATIRDPDGHAIRLVSPHDAQPR